MVFVGQSWQTYNDDNNDNDSDNENDENNEDQDEDDQKKGKKGKKGKKRGRPSSKKLISKKRKGNKTNQMKDDTLTVSHRLALIIPIAEVISEIYTRASIDQNFMFLNNCTATECTSRSFLLSELVTVLRTIQNSELIETEGNRKERDNAIKVMNRPRFKRMLQCSNLTLPTHIMESMAHSSLLLLSNTSSTIASSATQQQPLPTLLTVTSSMELIPSHLIAYYSSTQLRAQINNTTSLLHRISKALATLHDVTGIIIDEDKDDDDVDEEEEEEINSNKKKKISKKKKRKQNTSRYKLVHFIMQLLYANNVHQNIGHSASIIVTNINRSKISVPPYVEALQALTNYEQDNQSEDEKKKSKMSKMSEMSFTLNDTVLYAIEDEYFQMRASMLRLVRDLINLLEPIVGPKKLKLYLLYWNKYSNKNGNKNESKDNASKVDDTLHLYTNMSKIFGEHLYNEITVR